MQDLNPELSTGLCEFIGVFIGDGCIDSYVTEKGKSKHHISITGNSELDKDYLTKTIPLIATNLIGVESHIYFRNDSNAMTLNFYSEALFTMLTERFGFPIGKKTLTVKIPDEIFNASDDFVFAAIRGIFDTDGCIFLDRRKIYKKPYPRITLQIASKPLFLQLVLFLGKHFSLYTHYDSRKNSCCLEIYGHEQLAKWMQLIGFSNQRHLNKIKNDYGYEPWTGVEPAISS